MMPFKKYLGEPISPDWIDPDATLLSQTSLEKLMFERPTLEYCIVVPNNLNSRRDHDTIRMHFRESRHAMYPIAASNKQQYGRVYMIAKKPHTRSQDFREMVSDAYYALGNFDAVYTNGTTIKTLRDSAIQTIEEQPSITKFQEIISEMLGKKTKLHGVETAINEDIEYHFRNNNLISYPLTNHDRQYAKNWNDYLND